jgi:hypothetical protein
VPPASIRRQFHSTSQRWSTVPKTSVEPSPAQPRIHEPFAGPGMNDESNTTRSDSVGDPVCTLV